MGPVPKWLPRAATDINDVLYLERSSKRLGAFERGLNDVLARLPHSVKLRRTAWRFVKMCNEIGPVIAQMTDAELRQNLETNSAEISARGYTIKVLAQVLSVIREGSWRVLKMRHHDVQMLGAWTLLHGKLAEMQTGEGKSLVAAMAAIAFASFGNPVHVVTVNDYLAQRDAEEFKDFFAFFGFTIGLVQEGMEPDQRKNEYAQSVTFVSNKELVFDYLKDTLTTDGQSRSVQAIRRFSGNRAESTVLLRGLHVAIIDEADSVLIDEARTPLIISRSVEDPELPAMCNTALSIAQRLENPQHYTISAKRQVWLTDAGLARARTDFDLLEEANLLKIPLWQEEMLDKALKAIHLFTKDQHYIIRDGKIQIVDEFTGRVMADRSWEHGLHQMIEAKENLELSDRRDTLARMTYQRFFSRYLHLCGMTGTAIEVAAELRAVYKLNTVRIPPNKANRRMKLGFTLFTSERARLAAIAKACTRFTLDNRATLIGTSSVDASEVLGEFLESSNVPHKILNARQDSEESKIIAEAGFEGRVTVATSMAGRGTDIKLAHAVERAGGLHVILCDFSESPRVDRQLIGRGARQGDPGSYEFLASIDDGLFKQYAVYEIAMLKWLFSRTDHIPGFVGFALLRLAQRRAEAYNAAIRRQMLKGDLETDRKLAFVGGSK